MVRLIALTASLSYCTSRQQYVEFKLLFIITPSSPTQYLTDVSIENNLIDNEPHSIFQTSIFDI